METTTINGVEIIRDLDIEEYHKSPILSHTKIQHWLENTPQWWYAKYIEGKRFEGEEAAYFVHGRAIDTLLFDGEKEFRRLFTTAPKEYPSVRTLTKKEQGIVLAATDADVERAIQYHSEDKQDEFRSKPCAIEMKPWIGSAIYCQGWEASSGKTVLSSDMARMVAAEAKTVVANPLAHEIIAHKGAQFQITLRWEIDGIMVQARPDVINFDNRTWSDLKTVAKMVAVGKNFIFHGYDMQAGLVMDAMRRILGEDPALGTHIYVDKGFYPLCEVLDIFGGEVGPVYCEYGLARAMKAAREIEHARKTGRFERPQRARKCLVVPEWIQKKIVDAESFSADEILDTDDIADNLKF